MKGREARRVEIILRRFAAPDIPVYRDIPYILYIAKRRSEDLRFASRLQGRMPLAGLLHAVQVVVSVGISVLMSCVEVAAGVNNLAAANHNVVVVVALPVSVGLGTSA